MKRILVILILLIVLAILAFRGAGVWRAPGATTQSEQRRIKGMSLMAEDL
jgi:flagellar basal body-associated protein FliL